MERIAILFAMRRESAPFLRRLRSFPSPPGRRGDPEGEGNANPCRVWRAITGSKTIFVLETGIGPTAAAAATNWLLDNHSVSIVIAAGFAGALDPSLRVGDILVAEEIIDCGPAHRGGQSYPKRWRTHIPTALSDMPRGRLLSTPHLTSRPAEKLALGQHYQAAFVDMESAAVAAVCHDRGVSMTAIRAISDTVDTELSPRLVSLLNRGRVRPMRLIRAIVSEPKLIVELSRLARHTRRAASELATALVRIKTESI